jgi:hypothetical protein
MNLFYPTSFPIAIEILNNFTKKEGFLKLISNIYKGIKFQLHTTKLKKRRIKSSFILTLINYLQFFTKTDIYQVFKIYF